ncbi:hypothetical protein OUZ56_032681 [Daphnia magna]|uniref:C2H2-type domain-containing protein n=1 Tax=Daphnia magna TaxID=35525 RepID=A0ABQ9ZWT9_9CRUS|nr:hypothetical protein OUZ56_032681 [Daphnia magna]
MAEEGASSRNATRVRIHGNAIKIPVALPNKLRCGERACQGERGKKALVRGTQETVGGETHQSSTLEERGSVHDPGSPNPAHSPLPTFTPCRIEGDKIILRYLGGPTKCPRCEWTTLAQNTRGMGSIHRHLETAHTLRLLKYWECGVCGFAGDGPTLKGHYQRLHSASHQSSSILSPWFFNADTSIQYSSVVATFQEEIAVTEYDRQELSVMGMPAIEEEGPGVLERCTADWIPKAPILEDPSPGKPRENPNGRKRNQNRQMQKGRRQIKAYRARKIQRLFNIYRRRAVGEVLGDRSPSYDGTVEAAEEYLERAYHRSSLPSQQCQSARVLYDTCDWSHPSRDQMDFVNRAPSQKELEATLRRATYTSPGVDGLEYRHLRDLDPDCIF